MKRLIAALLATLLLASAATAAITLTFNKFGVAGDLKYVIATLDLDSSYRNGGETLTAENLGLSGIWQIDFTCDNDGYLLQYDYSEEKVIAFAVQDSLHAALYGPLVDIAPDTNAVDLSGVTDIQVFAWGW